MRDCPRGWFSVNLEFGKPQDFHGHPGNAAVDKVRVDFDREGNSLSVWFDDPKKEHVCEESGDDLILVKDRQGRVIGFERLNFQSTKQHKEGTGIPLKVQMV